MFYFSLCLGLYSLIILLFGHLGWFSREKIFLLNLALLITAVFWFVLRGRFWLIKLIGDIGTWLRSLSRWGKCLLIIGFSSVFINLAGVLTPEISYDALWYHLTIPKLLLDQGRLFFIPGGLLYYSAMPKLTEMYYLVALLYQGEILAKFIHFGFGILSAIVIYKIARLYLKKNSSILSAVIFYTMPVVSWLSTASYIDLARTFFEVLALYYFICWAKTKKDNYIIRAGLMVGFEVGTKLLGLGSIPIYIILIGLFSEKRTMFIRAVSKFIIFMVCVGFPWYLSAYILAGNPFHPIFAGVLGGEASLVGFDLFKFGEDFWQLFTNTADPLTPVVLILAPLVILNLFKLTRLERLLLWYCFFSYVVWYITPRTASGRFILPYMAGFVILVIVVFKKHYLHSSKKLIYFLIVLTVLGNLGFRVFGSAHFFPYIFGGVGKDEYLIRNLSFQTNVFYDIDGYFAKTIKENEKVLVYCSHNLFYMDFSFVHESWYKGGKYDYVLSQNCELLEKFNKLPLVYKNNISGVKLYKK